jgi:hypothetical protein
MTGSDGWSIRQVYLYLVCFATLMLVLIGSIQLVMGIVDLVYPERNGYPTAYEMTARYSELNAKNAAITLQDAARLAKEERRRQEDAMRRTRVKNLIRSAAFIAVAFPVYAYHWRRIQSATI